MRRISILGSTGSIGTQALEVIAAHPDRFRVAALAAAGSEERLCEQARRFRPALACLTGRQSRPAELPAGCRWAGGEAALAEAAAVEEADDVLVAVTGVRAALPAVLTALAAGKRVLLASKEALVAGGELVTRAARRAGQPLLPVDSEHSAIFQCLRAADGNAARRLILTASGGPFRTWAPEKIERAGIEQALRHPNWSMGRKITVDSATMLNKALEVIEARWLFDMAPEQLDVLIHPQSIIHSMVEFADGAVLAQLGVPDMRLPILYAMAFPQRLAGGAPPPNLAELGALTFEKPDAARFPGLRLAYDALAAGGTAGAALNAANEEAVAAFLAGKIPFGRIWRTVRDTMDRVDVRAADTVEAVWAADEQARRMAAAALA